jgi:predicted PurR-regulated permease PerM
MTEPAETAPAPTPTTTPAAAPTAPTPAPTTAPIPTAAATTTDKAEGSAGGPPTTTTTKETGAPTKRWMLLHIAVPLGLLVAAYFLRDVLTPIVAALFLAYALSPAVDRLQRWRIPRSLGAFLVLLLTFGGLLAILIVVLPAILGEFQRFVTRLPELLERFAAQTLPQIERTFGIDLPDDLHAALGQLADQVRKIAPDAAGPLARMLAHVVQGAAFFLGALFTVLLVPILAFFFLRDFPALVAGVRRELPGRYRPAVEAYLGEVDGIMSSYLRGQLLVVLCLAALYALGLGLIGLRLGVVIGLLAGFLAFIPYAGFAVGMALAMLMALLTFEGVWMYLGIVIVFGAVQALEGFVLTPLLIGRRVGLGMVGVLVAIIVFGATLGFVGVLLAVPLGAIFRVSFKRLMAWRAEIDREHPSPKAAG